MDGAGWNSHDGIIIESSPSKLFASFPIVLISAHYSKQAISTVSTSATSNKIKSNGLYDYDCPVYKYPIRTDRYKIFNVLLPSDVKPIHWVLRGVALLCQTT